MYEHRETDRQSSQSRQTGRWENQSSTSCSLSDFLFSFFVRRFFKEILFSRLFCSFFLVAFLVVCRCQRPVSVCVCVSHHVTRCCLLPWEPWDGCGGCWGLKNLRMHVNL